MSDLIFGHSWAAIQRAQRGSHLHERVTISDAVAWLDSDESLLRQHGTKAALEAAGFYGVADRAARLGKFTEDSSYGEI